MNHWPHRTSCIWITSLLSAVLLSACREREPFAPDVFVDPVSFGRLNDAPAMPGRDAVGSDVLQDSHPQPDSSPDVADGEAGYDSGVPDSFDARDAAPAVDSAARDAGADVRGDDGSDVVDATVLSTDVNVLDAGDGQVPDGV